MAARFYMRCISDIEVCNVARVHTVSRSLKASLRDLSSTRCAALSSAVQLRMRFFLCLELDPVGERWLPSESRRTGDRGVSSDDINRRGGKGNKYIYIEE